MTRQKKRRILRIELSWMMMMESQRRTLRVFSLSLSRDRWRWNGGGDADCSFFRVLRLLVLTKEKPSSRVRAIILRILPWERKTHRILYLHGLRIFYRLFHRTGHVGDRNRFRYLQKTVVTSFISIRRLSQLQSRRGRDECARGRHHDGHHFIFCVFVWKVVKIFFITKTEILFSRCALRVIFERINSPRTTLYTSQI